MTNEFIFNIILIIILFKNNNTFVFIASLTINKFLENQLQTRARYNSTWNANLSYCHHLLWLIDCKLTWFKFHDMVWWIKYCCDEQLLYYIGYSRLRYSALAILSLSWNKQSLICRRVGVGLPYPYFASRPPQFSLIPTSLVENTSNVHCWPSSCFTTNRALMINKL